MNGPPSVPHAQAREKRKKDGKRNTETNGFSITLMSNRQTPDCKKERKNGKNRHHNFEKNIDRMR